MSGNVGDTNKFGNAVGLPFSSFSVESGVLDLAYSADDLRRMNDMFWLDGVRQDSVDWFDGDGAVKWTNGFNIVVRPFRGHVNGTIVYAPQVYLEVEPQAEGSRIDSVIVRRDYAARTVNVLLKQGVVDSGLPPELTYNDGAVAEMELARVTVRAEVASLAQSDITDMRRPLVADMGVSPSAGESGRFVRVGAKGEYILGSQYRIGEFKHWYEQVAPSGWLMCNGRIIESVDVDYPELWAFVTDPANNWKVKTMAEWQAQSNDWQGVGGVLFFGIDVNARQVRLPDTRGMYIEGAGFAGRSAGDVHKDAMQKIWGTFSVVGARAFTIQKDGAFNATGTTGSALQAGGYNAASAMEFNSEWVVRTAAQTEPRGACFLHCIYVGGI